MGHGDCVHLKDTVSNRKKKRGKKNKRGIVRWTIHSEERVAQSRKRRKIDIAGISQKSRDYFNINLDNGFRIFTENQIILIKLKAIISTRLI